MEDRIPANPGRVLVTPENGGAAYYATLTRADNPTQEGTPLNKANLLTDATAALFGLSANAVPNDVFSTARALIARNATDIANGVKIETGSYTGTGGYKSTNPNTLTFPFNPQIVIVSGVYNSTPHIMIAIQGVAMAAMTQSIGSAYIMKEYCTWGEKSLSWYYDGEYAEWQLNASGITYKYIAIG